MNFILDKIAQINTLNVIGILRNEDAETYYVLKITKNKNKLELISDAIFIDSEILFLSLEPKIPILLLVDGKGILNKKLDLKNDADSEWLKNLDYATIHYSNLSTINNQFFSFCRKNVAEDLIAVFQKKGFQVVDFYIGALFSILLKDTLQKSKIFSNDSVLDVIDEQLFDVTKSSDLRLITNYDIAEKTVSNYHLPLYGASIHFYTKQKAITKSSSNLINNEEILYKKGFEKLGIVMIIGFFIMLLTSYFLIQYYTSKNTKLNLENVYSNQTFELIQKLEAQKENKLNIVNETGISSSKFISFYAYEIAKSTTSEINLSGIAVFPLTKEIKGIEKADFDSSIITINGFTSDESSLNSWLEKIRNFNWIQNLEIISLKKDKKNVSFFELKISLKNV